MQHVHNTPVTKSRCDRGVRRRCSLATRAHLGKAVILQHGNKMLLPTKGGNTEERSRGTLA
eukprot:scaffold39677_cov48-Phaeocystis_antarctica.AAC.1